MLYEVITCLQAGCSEYLVKSGEVVETLPETISRLLEEEQESVVHETVSIIEEPATEDGHLIVFLSAKGGIV